MNNQRIMDSLDNLMDGIEDYMERFAARADLDEQWVQLLQALRNADRILNPQDLLTMLGRALELIRRYEPESKYHRAVQDILSDLEQARRASQGGEK